MGEPGVAPGAGDFVLPLLLPFGVPVLARFGVVLELFVEKTPGVLEAAIHVEQAVRLACLDVRLPVRLVTELDGHFVNSPVIAALGGQRGAAFRGCSEFAFEPERFRASLEGSERGERGLASASAPVGSPSSFNNWGQVSPEPPTGE
jgi:hypothetical protein